MSAERGWIGEPQPAKEWHASHYSRAAERIARRQYEIRRKEEFAQRQASAGGRPSWQEEIRAAKQRVAEHEAAMQREPEEWVRPSYVSGQSDNSR